MHAPYVCCAQALLLAHEKMNVRMDLLLLPDNISSPVRRTVIDDEYVEVMRHDFELKLETFNETADVSPLVVGWYDNDGFQISFSSLWAGTRLSAFNTQATVGCELQQAAPGGGRGGIATRRPGGPGKPGISRTN